MIENKDSLEFMKSQKDYSADIIYADPPYALGSEIIGAIKAGFTDWLGCEINTEYIDIANARIKYWINADINKNQNNFVKSLFEDNVNDNV